MTPAEGSIDAFHANLVPGDRAICDVLRAGIEAVLTEAESKIWHRHPVWFLSANPIVGYSRLKACVRLMFWSGQSFQTHGLEPDGSFKAASARFTSADQIEGSLLRAWLTEARTVQWDYKNIVKRRGQLVRLS